MLCGRLQRIVFKLGFWHLLLHFRFSSALETKTRNILMDGKLNVIASQQNKVRSTCTQTGR